MRVIVILAHKGADVTTIGPGATLADAARALADHRIGALVVSGDGDTVDGMLSERDIVRHLARSGGEALDVEVAEAMTTEVVTCRPDTTADELMAMMTERRIRHVPVLDDGRLVGIVSIGDVVKSRIDELEIETETLQEYVTGTGY
ncbi:MAG: CBS domain-containing protein [Egibacteraceae bacterium]